MKVELKLAEFRRLANSPAVIALLQERAQRIASAAGEGNVVKPPERGRRRARVAVVTESFQARYYEATERRLTRSMGGK